MNLEHEGSHVGTCSGHHVRIPHVLFAERAERVSGMLRTSRPARETLQAWRAGDVISGNLTARMSDKQHTSHVGNSPRASAVWNWQSDVMAARIGRWRDVGITHKDERACHKPPPRRCRKKKKPRSMEYGPAGCGGYPVVWGTGSTS